MKKWMGNAMQAVRTFYLNYTGFAVVLVVQALVLLYLFVSLFIPAKTLEISLASIVPMTPTDAVHLTEQGLLIENTAENTSEIMFNSVPVALGAGAYTIDITYDSVYNVGQPSGSMQEESAVLLFEATGAQGLFVEMPDKLRLTDAAKHLQNRIWVARGQAVDTLLLTLYYNGVGRVQIESIVLQEQIAWRVVEMLAVCIAFVLCNVVVYLLLVKRTEQNKCKMNFLKVAFSLLGIAVFASLPFFVDYVYHGHDMMFHATRIASVAAELRNGQFPVRMMTEMLNGYGYANSLFYCDIFLYFPAVLYNCMLPLQMAYQIYVFMVNLATACIAYYAFCKMANSICIALVGAGVYTLSTYRLINVYTRAAVGEYTAMTFFPLIALGLWGIYQSEKPTLRHWLPLALGMAGVLQCHVLSVEIVCIFLGVFCVLLLQKTLCIVRIKALACAAMLCLGLSAWFIVPFIQSFLTIDIRATQDIVTELQSSGVYLRELFSFSAFSIATTTSNVFTVGWGLWCGVALAIWLMLQRKNPEIVNQVQYKTMQFVLLLGSIAAVFTLKVFPWNAIGYGIHPIIARVVNLVQFSWRYLVIASICFAVVLVLALVLVRQYIANCFKTLMCAIIAINIIWTGAFYADFVAIAATRELYTFTAEETLTVGRGEYKPAGGDAVDVTTSLAVPSSEDFIIYDYRKENGIAYLTYENISDTAQSVLLPIWYYPNYQATDMNTGAQYELHQGEENCLSITVPAGGSGIVQVAYVVPMLWRIAECMTLCSWAILAVLLVKKQKGRNT